MMMPGVAPLGGALADDPHMELPPVLMALDSPPQRVLAAEVESSVDADGRIVTRKRQPHHKPANRPTEEHAEFGAPPFPVVVLR
jgi:hypothetical protein